MHQVSHDIDFEHTLQLKDGRRMSAIDIQRFYLDCAVSYVKHLECDDEQTMSVLQLWSQTLGGLAHDPSLLKTSVDWIAKRNMLDAYRNRDGLQWSHPRLSAIDFQYADLRPEKGLAYLLQSSGGLETMFTTEEIYRAVGAPPEDTRAYFRGMCMKTYGDYVAAASWDSVILDVDVNQDLMRVTTPDASKGTRALAEHLFEQPSVSQFLHELQLRGQSAIG